MIFESDIADFLVVTGEDLIAKIRGPMLTKVWLEGSRESGAGTYVTVDKSDLIRCLQAEGPEAFVGRATFDGIIYVHGFDRDFYEGSSHWKRK